MSIAFEDEHIEAHIATHSSPYLLITFAPSTLTANGNRFWGDNLVAKTNIAAVGLIAKKPNWYPRASVEAAEFRCREYVQSYSERVTYGASMGAFGAIRYARLFGATTSIAFAPQYSINPKLVQEWDRRFTRYFDADIDPSSTISGSDVSCVTYLFYDKFYEVDRRSAELISAINDKVRLINVPMVGHQPIELFSGTKKAIKMLDACRSGDLPDLLSMIRLFRRTAQARTVAIVEGLSSRRPGVAEKILGKRLRDAADPIVFRLLYHIANGYFRLGDVDKSEKLAISCLQNKMDDGVLRLLADVAQRRFDFTKALKLLREAEIINDKQPGTYARIASLYHSMGKFKDAEIAIERALELNAENESLQSLREKIIASQA
jgi:tetratricopeptide (TPR) repeat protein